MGTFHTKCKIENPTDRTRSVVLPKLLVDSGSEYTWVSERLLERIGIRPEKKDVTFVLANGQEVTLALRSSASTSFSLLMKSYSRNRVMSY